MRRTLHAFHVPVAISIAAALMLFSMPVAVFADKEADVAALEARCEADREERIKPLREMEIANCKADKRNDPAYCERYWKDYGNAQRGTNGRMLPRMFDDLPSCVAASEARNALAKQ
jgi:hypothetical protein